VKNLCRNDLFQEAFTIVANIELSQNGYMHAMWIASAKKYFDKARWIFQVILDRGMVPNSLTYVVMLLNCVMGNRHSAIEGVLSHMLVHGDEEAKILARILRTYRPELQLEIIPKLRILEFNYPGNIAAFIKQHKHRLNKQYNDDSYNIAVENTCIADK
jgi:hypothetical protein